MENKQGNFFEIAYDKKEKTEGPLASRMRPTRLEDFQGQHHIVGKGKMLNRLIPGLTGFLP